ncbi:MAG: M48 family metallopeptidase [Elusimicrobia bacterium]|nr:M48 family metallopeptidase [Elusimicrobiota bacterium]
MKNLFLWVSLVSPLLLAACATIPVSGRRSFNIVPEDQELTLGVQAYKEVIGQAKVSPDSTATAMVRRVGERIARVSDRPDYDWEYILIDDPKNQNAFCLPGGKVAVYSGILPVTKTEAGLAVVLGHEIAHAIAKHGAERMSQNLLINLGGQTLEVALQKKPAETRQMVIQAFGLGATIGAVLPFGRSQESEADRIGLIYMAKAGYNPQEALAFWKRMETASSGQSPPQFLSTHPSHETRIRDLERWMPEADQIYKNTPK